MSNDNEVLLKVEDLCQYFKMGKRELRAVDKVNFDIRRGEVFGLVGESGCGKTTTGRTVIKLYPTTSGNVYLKGQRICAGTRSMVEQKRAAAKACAQQVKELTQEMAAFEKGSAEAAEKAKQIAAVKADYAQKASALNAEIRAAKSDQKSCDKKYAANKLQEVKAEFLPQLEVLKADPAKAEEYAEKLKEYKAAAYRAKHERLITQIQMIFQDPIASLNPRMTVREIIAEGLIIKGIKDKKYIDEKVYEVLETVGLVREHAGRYPHEFSGGQRQRIGIARSIILQPELIIADEPISALDVSIQAQVISLLNELRQKIGLTILFIAHDLSVVKYFSDRIAVMYYGKIVELATSDELFAHPLHPYTRALLSAIPLPDPIYEKRRKRIIYNPVTDHDYTEDGPQMHEIVPGHKILCNTAELNKYKAELGLE